MKVTEVVETAPGELGVAMARVKVDEIKGNAPVVDIKILKRAILEIERTDPEAKSIRISPVDYYATGIVFVGLSTKKQEEDAEQSGQNIIHIMAPLTVHVDRADKFEDVDPQVFLDRSTETVEILDPAKKDLYRFDIVEEEPGADEQPKKKRIVVGLNPMTGDPNDELEPGYIPTGYKKPRKRRKKEVVV